VVSTILIFIHAQDALAVTETLSLSSTGRQEVVREYTYGIGEDAPAIEERYIGDDGTVYILKEHSNPLLNMGAVSENPFSLTVRRPVSVDVFDQGEAAVRAAFDKQLTIDTGGFAGILHLQDVSSEPVYRSTERQIEREVIFPDLPSEDVAQLPTSGVFTVGSDSGLDATVDSTLERLAVSWITTGEDGYGRPAVYQATVIYRGIERELILDYYWATATYDGILPAKPLSQTVSATYEAQETREVPTSAVAVPLNIPETVIPLAVAPSRLPLIMIAATAVVMLLALLFLLYFFLYKNARLVRRDGLETCKVVTRQRLRLEDGETVFKIDSDYQMYCEGVSHQIVLSKRLASKQGQLVALWGNRMVLRTSLKREIDISEELVKALSGSLDSILDEEDGLENLETIEVRG
jgi:hypothetical protein